MCIITINEKDNLDGLGNPYATLFRVRFWFSFRYNNRIESRTRAITFLITSKNGVPLRDATKNWWNPECLISDLRDKKIMELGHGFIYYLIRDLDPEIKIDEFTPVFYQFITVNSNDMLRGCYMKAERLCSSTNRGYQHHATVEHVGPKYHEEYDIWIIDGDTEKYKM